LIDDPRRRGEALHDFYAAVAPRLFDQMVETGEVPAAALAAPAHRARREWECLALHACVRGLVAAGGFNLETAAAIDAFHQRVLEAWTLERDAGEPLIARRERLADRYAEYGAIGQEGGAAAAADVPARVGAAWAAHVAGGDFGEHLASLAGSLQEVLAEGAAEAVRIAG